MFTLEEWKLYKVNIDEDNAAILHSCAVQEEKMKNDYAISVEKRRKTWIAWNGSESGFYAGTAGWLQPTLKHPTIVGCLDWLSKKEESDKS